MTTWTPQTDNGEPPENQATPEGSAADTTWTPQTDNGDPPTDPQRSLFFLDDLSNIATVNAYLQIVASSGGGEVFIYPHSRGYHLPESLDTGLSIVVPANVSLRAVGLVQVRWDNPTRPCFLMTGTGGALLGQWYIIGDYIAGDAVYQWRDGEVQADWPGTAKISRMNQSWAAGDADYAAWAIAHHAAHPDYPLLAYNASNWSTAWDAAFPHTKWELSGAFKAPNRCAAVASAEADDIVIEDLRISNFISGVMLAGRAGIIASDAVAPDYQARNIKIGRVRGDLFEFLVLATRQANNTIEEATVEWNGLRIQDKQPHVLYLSNEPADHEWSDATHVGVVRAKGYNGGSVVKAKAQRGFTWDEIYASGSQSAINILEYCTGVGGNVILEDQCESPSPGTNFAVRINFSPGFVIAGKIKVDHRANVNDLRGLSIENSDDVKILQGIDLSVARASAGQPLCRIRNSKRAFVGTFNYQDANSRNTLLWTLSDSQDDGGNASNCTFEFGDVRGTNRLIEFLGLSSNNEIRFDPRRIENFDVEDVLVNDGLGSGNYYVDVSSGNRRVLNLSASTALTAKASNTLTVPRETPSEEDEEDDVIGAPKLFANNDTVTINGRIRTWKTTLTGADDEILIPNSGLAATYPQMGGKEFGYLQLAFLDAAIRLDTAYGAGNGVIYNTTLGYDANVISDWGGNELNIAARASGTGPNSFVCSVSSASTGATWADGTTSDTLTGGGGFDAAYFNRSLLVTTGATNRAITLPTTGEEGAYAEIVKVDAGAGQVDCGGLATLVNENDRAVVSYEAGEWRAAFFSGDYAAIIVDAAAAIADAVDAAADANALLASLAGYDDQLTALDGISNAPDRTWVVADDTELALGPIIGNVFGDDTSGDMQSAILIDDTLQVLVPGLGTPLVRANNLTVLDGAEITSGAIDADLATILPGGTMGAGFKGSNLIATGVREDVGRDFAVNVMDHAGLPASNFGRGMTRYFTKLARYKRTGNGVITIMKFGDSWADLVNIPNAERSWFVAEKSVALSGHGWVSSSCISGRELNDVVTGSAITSTFTGTATLFDAGEDAGLTVSVPACGCGVDGYARYDTGTSFMRSISGVTCTEIKFFYRNMSQVFRWRVDGGSYTTVTATGDNSLGVLSITGLSNATHSIDIDGSINTGGTLNDLGFWFTRASVAGVTLAKCGNGGADSEQLAVVWAHAVPKAILANIQPDRCDMLIGTNDMNRRKAFSSLTTMVDAFVEAVRLSRPYTPTDAITHDRLASVGFEAPGATYDGGMVRPIFDYAKGLYQLAIKHRAGFYNNSAIVDNWEIGNGGPYLSPDSTATLYNDDLRHFTTDGAYFHVMLADKLNYY